MNPGSVWIMVASAWTSNVLGNQSEVGFANHQTGFCATWGSLWNWNNKLYYININDTKYVNELNLNIKGNWGGGVAGFEEPSCEFCLNRNQVRKTYLPVSCFLCLVDQKHAQITSIKPSVVWESKMFNCKQSSEANFHLMCRSTSRTRLL